MKLVTFHPNVLHLMIQSYHILAMDSAGNFNHNMDIGSMSNTLSTEILDCKIAREVW